MRADAETGATGASSAAETAELSAWFGDSPAAGGRSGVWIAAAQSAIQDGVSPDGCAVIDTDQATYVEATFTGCSGPGGRADLTGTIRGELEVETRPCGPAQCPVAALWSVTAALTFGDGGTLDGAWLVTAPIAPSANRTFDGSVEVTGRYGSTVSAVASAQWVVVDDGCMALDADATLDDQATLTVTALTWCPGRCPSAGEVTFEGERGTLFWSYDGGATVTAAGTGDRDVELPLLCSPAP